MTLSLLHSYKIDSAWFLLHVVEIIHFRANRLSFRFNSIYNIKMEIVS